MLTLKQRVDALAAELDKLKGTGTSSQVMAGSATLKDQFTALCGHTAISQIVRAVAGETDRTPAALAGDLEQLREQLAASEENRRQLAVDLTRISASAGNVSDRAKEILAAAGIRPGVTKDAPANVDVSSDAPVNAAEFMERYNAIEDPIAAATFYKKFSSIIE
jgi:hypothetical protein